MRKEWFDLANGCVCVCVCGKLSENENACLFEMSQSMQKRFRFSVQLNIKNQLQRHIQNRAFASMRFPFDTQMLSDGAMRIENPLLISSNLRCIVQMEIKCS